MGWKLSPSPCPRAAPDLTCCASPGSWWCRVHSWVALRMAEQSPWVDMALAESGVDTLPAPPPLHPAPKCQQTVGINKPHAPARSLEGLRVEGELSP